MSDKNASFEQIANAFHEHRKFCVISHVRPDGDALGSTLAVSLSLQELGKDVRAWNEEGMLEKYRFLAGGESLTVPPGKAEDFDVVVALDTATHNRLGTPLNSISRAKLWINIDHHPSNPRYGDLVYIDPTAPATGQIIFELMCAAKMPISPAIAENLYAAISTDTGSFQYSNTTARTFEIGAELIRRGVEVGRISQLLYESFPRRRIELLRELLDHMHFAEEGKLAWFSLSQAAAHGLGVLPEDNEGLIDQLRAIRGVIVAIFFEELPDGKVRVSMRSKDEAVDVCAICQSFGGGGHTLAAGARVKGSLEEVAKIIVEKASESIAANT